MKTFGILALGGAMGVQFEDLSYNNLRAAFMEVSLKISYLKKSEIILIKIFRLFQKFMATKISILESLATTIYHSSNGATQMEMGLSLFMNQLNVDQKQDSGTHLKSDGLTGPPTQPLSLSTLLRS